MTSDERLAEIRKRLNFIGVSGGQLMFEINKVPFVVDCYSDSVGELGAARIGAWHDFVDLVYKDS